MSVEKPDSASQKTVAATPVKVVDQSIEVFEVYSEKLGQKITIGLKHSAAGDTPAYLMSDAGLVMMPVPPDHGIQQE